MRPFLLIAMAFNTNANAITATYIVTPVGGKSTKIESSESGMVVPVHEGVVCKTNLNPPDESTNFSGAAILSCRSADDSKSKFIASTLALCGQYSGTMLIERAVPSYKKWMIVIGCK